MDEESFEKRQRCRNFSTAEVIELIKLIKKYKHVLQNKSYSSSACLAKDETWLTITNLFNNKGFECVRSTEHLRNKWENIKRGFRQQTNEKDPIYAMVASIIDNKEMPESYSSLMSEDKSEIIDEDDRDESILNDLWNEKNESADERILSGGNSFKTARARSSNFSPQECSLLLQCVKKEKHHLFSKSISSEAMQLKSKAWCRITDSYNKLNPRKRDMKTLRTKFINMRNVAKQLHFKGIKGKHKKPNDETFDKEIKTESTFETISDDSTDCIDNNAHSTQNEIVCDFYSVTEPVQKDNHLDPLASNLNSMRDSGHGVSRSDLLNHVENPEVVKLKLELLNYQMETAKMERHRVECLVREDELSRESRALERALRVRAARLEAEAAALRLPAAHPALKFPPQEARAEYYLR